MAFSARSIYRVRQIVGHGTAIIVEVKKGELHGGKAKETRDARMILGGPDTFWQVTGEHKGGKLQAYAEDGTASFFATSSPVADRFLGSSALVVPRIVRKNDFDTKPESVSFHSTTRLCVGYSPEDSKFEETVSALRAGTLLIPLNSAVSAIEVAPGRWLTCDFDLSQSGRYALRGQSVSNIATCAIENKPDVIRLEHGIVVFLSQPRWSESSGSDLRSESEIIESVELWLSRVQAAFSLAGGTETVAPAELFVKFAASAVTAEEKAELATIATRFSQHEKLIDVLPKILGREPNYLKRIEQYEAEEKVRISARIEEQVRAETALANGRLAELRNEIEEAEIRLATFSHREALLRVETDKHEDMLRRKIEAAVGALRKDADREAARLQEEVSRLHEEISKSNASPPATVTEEEDKAASDETFEAPRIADGQERAKGMEDLVAATGLDLSEVAAIISASTEAVPVIVGAGGASAAVDFGTILSGKRAAVVFCDPTRVSLSDLLLDANSGLTSAIEDAKRWPALMWGVALCNITSGPCEYWLPQMIEMRRAGRLPRNLALIASAADDGARISVPGSVLRHLLPFEPQSRPCPITPAHAGAWPMAESDRDRLKEATGLLFDAEVDGSALKTMARMISRTPPVIGLEQLRSVFVRQAGWQSACAKGAKHDFNRYFKDLED